MPLTLVCDCRMLRAAASARGTASPPASSAVRFSESPGETSASKSSCTRGRRRSAPITSVLRPARASARPRFAVTVVLPFTLDRARDEQDLRLTGRELEADRCLECLVGLVLGGAQHLRPAPEAPAHERDADDHRAVGDAREVTRTADPGTSCHGSRASATSTPMKIAAKEREHRVANGPRRCGTRGRTRRFRHLQLLAGARLADADVAQPRLERLLLHRRAAAPSRCSAAAGSSSARPRAAADPACAAARGTRSRPHSRSPPPALRSAQSQ